jgi:ribosome biogenesis GTPase
VIRRASQRNSRPSSPVTQRAASRLLEGQVVASFGRRYLIELADGSTLDCVTRGKRGQLACGDRVTVARGGAGKGVIEAVGQRATLLYRSDAAREKLVAANVTQVVVVVAPVPAWSEDLVNRCIAAAEHGGIPVLIALNKSDLPQAQAALAALELYRQLGYRVVALSARHDLDALVPHLKGKTSVLVGQSGMGKSTIINGLIPAAAVRVAEVSAALDSGRHTTTHTRLYHLDPSSHIIDSPGMQLFGLHHVDEEAIAQAFVEFRPWLGHCRFRDCRHVSEPGCAVAAACKRGGINARRLESYRGLIRERNP